MTAARLAGVVAGFFRRHFLVAITGLHQPQVADVPRQRHLGGRDVLGLQLLRQLFLGGDPFAPDQLQNLALTISLGHKISCPSTCLASASARATDTGPVPPGISRVPMPFSAFSSSANSPVNSGAKRRISSAVQSDGFLPVRTLSKTKRPTIWCAW